MYYSLIAYCQYWLLKVTILSDVWLVQFSELLLVVHLVLQLVLLLVLL